MPWGCTGARVLIHLLAPACSAASPFSTLPAAAPGPAVGVGEVAHALPHQPPGDLRRHRRAPPAGRRRDGPPVRPLRRRRRERRGRKGHDDHAREGLGSRPFARGLELCPLTGAPLGPKRNVLEGGLAVAK